MFFCTEQCTLNRFIVWRNNLSFPETLRGLATLSETSMKVVGLGVVKEKGGFEKPVELPCWLGHSSQAEPLETWGWGGNMDAGACELQDNRCTSMPLEAPFLDLILILSLAGVRFIGEDFCV